jgi:hypothetical protein
MSKSSLVETHFRSGEEAPELEDYRPISPLVVAACVAAVLSLLAVAHPLLWVLPVVAVVLSISAIVRVSAEHSRSGGRGVAVAALCFAALIGSYAPARSISRDRALFSQARAKAEEWISLIQQGRIQEAHQLSLSPSDRFQGPGSLDDHYTAVPPERTMSDGEADDLAASADLSPPPAAAIETFMAKPAIAKLLEFGTDAKIEHLQDDTIVLVYGDLTFTQHFRASRVRDGQTESFDFWVRSTRREQSRSADWNVGEIDLVK